MLEAKVKDHEHRRKRSQKRKALTQKNLHIFRKFLGILKKKKKIYARKIENSPQNFREEKKKVMTLAHFNNSKIVLSSTEDRAFSRNCRLRGQGQGLQNVSSRPRTPPLLHTLKSNILKTASRRKLVVHYDEL